jgi:hypothetical protein
MKRVILFLAIFFAIGFTPAPAEIIHIPGDYPTIQEGIDAANEGDTVLVHPGMYVENINFNEHNIVLGSLFLTTRDTAYIAQTVIDGDSSGSVVTFENWEDSTTVIVGFTIQNGYAENGGGIYCITSSPVIEWNVISLNSASGGIFNYGGGIFCGYYSEAIIRNNIISGNIAGTQTREGSYGGGIYCYLYSHAQISRNYIIENIACWGGGIGADLNSSPDISNNIIARNIADP